MRAVIQKVLESEAEAKRLLQAAKAEAEACLSQAQKQAQELLAQARQGARAEAERLMENATQAAEREKQARLTQALAEITTRIGLDETLRQRAIAGMLRSVIGQR